MRLLCTLFAVAACALGQPNPASLSSPDGNLQVSFRTDEAGKLLYEVSTGGKAVITPSALALEFQGRGNPLGANVRMVSATPVEWRRGIPLAPRQSGRSPRCLQWPPGRA
jgi:hypothetical protein